MAKNPRLLDLALERKPAADHAVVRRREAACRQDQARRRADDLPGANRRAGEGRASRTAPTYWSRRARKRGGHGVSRGTFALVPAVVDAARGMPVAAAGGVADGRGLAAALMLGADGVLVGTRFYATQEAMGRKRAKERIVAASGDKTIRSILFDIARRNVWPAPYTGRVLRNEFSERWRGREAELMQHQAEEAARYDKAREAGDFDTAAVIAGEGVDMISDIPPAREVVDRMIKEAAALLSGSNRYRIA